MVENEYLLAPELRQKTILTQRQRQGLELLLLPWADLETRLENELSANPLLEELPPDEPLPEEKESEAPPEPFDDSTLAAEAVDQADSWADELPLPDFSDGDRTETARGGDDFLRYTAAAEPDFRTLLEAELGASGAEERLLPAAEAVIDSLDERGILTVPDADLAMSLNLELPEIERAIELVQSFDPPGIAARSLPECWLLQLRRKGESTPLLEQILTGGAEDLAANRLPRLAAKLGISLDTLGKELRKLKELAPVPVPDGGGRRVDYIAPDAEIVPEGEGFAARIFSGRRRLAIAPGYRRMLDEPDLPAEARDYLEGKLKNAVELLKSLELRKSTLLRLTELLIETQEPFLRHGVSALKPLTMKTAAEKLELSESTVSRAVSEKFVATPRGIFPFRYFFTSGYTAENGENVSSRAVMEKLRELVETEDPRAPLSDEQLVALLKSAGFSIARRTVAKYRDLLKIPGSGLRKKHV